ncbi:MAG: DUF3553 domain-containing protein, partial [Pseudomonadota bacterium]
YNSPGWRRLQARSGDRPISQPKESRNTVIDLNAVSSFTVGERVFHQKFGYGTVRSVDNDKLTIDFDHSGEKRVMDSFVVAAKDAG